MDASTTRVMKASIPSETTEITPEEYSGQRTRIPQMVIIREVHDYVLGKAGFRKGIIDDAHDIFGRVQIWVTCICILF